MVWSDHVPEASSSESPGTRGERCKPGDRRGRQSHVVRRQSGVPATPGEHMASGQLISQPFLLNSPSGRDDSERKLGGSVIRVGRDLDSPAAPRPRAGSRGSWSETLYGFWPLERFSPPPAAPAAWRVCPGPRPSAESPGAQGPHLESRRPVSARNPHLGIQRRTGCPAAPQTPGPRPLLAVGPALPPPGCAMGPPGLAAYLSSSQRGAPGRPRPRGDIRAPGSGSGPHLQAPAAAGEAPRPATGGGSAEQQCCPGSRPPLRSVRA